MQESTPNPYVSPLFDPAVLASPDYLDAFHDGLNAYGEHCEDEDRRLTGAEVCEDIRIELDPDKERTGRSGVCYSTFRVCL